MVVALPDNNRLVRDSGIMPPPHAHMHHHGCHPHTEELATEFVGEGTEIKGSLRTTQSTYVLFAFFVVNLFETTKNAKST
jgi:hypothetical protein